MAGGGQLATFTSMAEDLNLGGPTTNPASGQSGTQTWDHWIESDAPTTWARCLLESYHWKTWQELWKVI